MDRLVIVDTKELLLQFKRNPNPKSNKPSSSNSSSSSQHHRFCCSASFRVTNLMHTMSVAVHLSTTRPSSFSISPTTAVLPPLATCALSLHLLMPSSSSSSPDGIDFPPLVSPSDSLVVRSTMLPTGKADTAHLLRLFSSKLPAPHVFTDARLPIFFVGPDAILSLLLSPSASETTTSLDTAFLLSKAVSACSPADLSSLLLHAASAGNRGFVSALLHAGADVHAHHGAPRDHDPNHRNKSAISLAVAAGCLETVELLLTSGARIDPGLDLLVMHEAASKNRVDLMAALADSDRTAAAWWGDAVDSAGRTPLHVAAIQGHLEAVRFCLPPSSSGGGCDPNRADADGWTPLHHAAAGGFVDVAEVLLQRSSHSAKYLLTADGRRKTPFDLAVDAGQHDNARLLDILRLGDFLHRAAASGDAGGVRSCLARGAAVDRRDQNGWTPLHRAAFKGRTEVVEVLIEHGAQLDAVDDAGYTPLRCAAEAGQAAVALCLVAHGAALTELKGLTMKGLNCCPSAVKVKLDTSTTCADDALLIPSSVCR